jgi:biotin carboxylase
MQHTIGLFGTFSGYEQIEMVKQAVALGYRPVVVTHADFAPPAEVTKLAAHTFKTEFDFESDAAFDDIFAQMQRAGVRLTAVFPAIEMGVIMTGIMAERFGLPWNSPDTARMFRDKREQRARLAAAGIDNPRLLHFETREQLLEILSQVRFPSVFKPVSGFGKVGVQFVNSPKELLNAFDSFFSNDREHWSLVSFPGGFLVEEFIQGQKVTVEILIAGLGQVMPVVVSESTVLGLQFMEMGHAVPCSLPDAEQSRIKSYALNVIQALRVTRGVVHLELLRQADGTLFVIEANGRCPGGRMTTLIREASGKNYLRAAIQTAAEGVLPEPFLFASSAAVYWFLRENGTLAGVDGFDQADASPGFIEKYLAVKIGDRMRALGDALDRVGFCMCSASTTAEAKDRARRLAEGVRLIVDRGTEGVA